ncbi:Uma2 family endonuclease [Clostridium sp. SYSU_GA19001]|nr:Uma2 family endonuclease [Clostridium caldaquaticum]
MQEFECSIYKGIPKLIVEILSWTTKDRDTGTKLQVYERFKVSEYWIVDPFKMVITVYSNNVNGVYSKIVKYNLEDKIVWNNNYKLKIAEVFDNLI